MSRGYNVWTSRAEAVEPAVDKSSVVRSYNAAIHQLVDNPRSVHTPRTCRSTHHPQPRGAQPRSRQDLSPGRGAPYDYD